MLGVSKNVSSKMSNAHFALLYVMNLRMGDFMTLFFICL